MGKKKIVQNRNKGEWKIIREVYNPFNRITDNVFNIYKGGSTIKQKTERLLKKDTFTKYISK